MLFFKKINLQKQVTTKMLLSLCVLFASFATIFSLRDNIYEAYMRWSIRKEYIVVSFTTTPYRIDKIKPVLDFLFAESIPIKTIYVNIPHIFKRDNIPYIIPTWLQQEVRVKILRTQDYGPGTKLLGTLEQANLPKNAIIITVDDDVQYPKNMLLYLAYKAKQNPSFAVGFSGMNPHYNKHGQIITDSLGGIGLKSDLRDKAFVSILEGFAGIAYRRKFFDDKVFNIQNAPRECINSDDLYLSFYLAEKGIPRQVVRTKAMSLDRIAWNPEVGLQQDALHQLSPRPAERHRACVAFMKEQNPKVIF